jgi:RHS repeat-associated protein
MLRGGGLPWRELLAQGLLTRRDTPADLAVPSMTITGRVVDARGRGVAGVPVVLGEGAEAVAARTDARGRFVLRNLTDLDPSKLLVIDGPGAPARGRYARSVGTLSQYATGVSAASVGPPTLNVVLPSVDLAHATDFRRVPASRAVDVKTSALPGFVLHVAAGGAATASGRAYRGRIAVTPLAGPNGSLAVGIDGPGLVFRAPMKVSLPNTIGAAPGTTFPLLTVGPAGAVATAGMLQVSADGSSIGTVSGGITGPCTILAPQAVTPAPSIASGPTASGESEPTRVIEDVEGVDFSVHVGETLDVSVQPGGFSGEGVEYTIVPQPLPANMSFNIGTGELIVVPAPGQVGTYEFQVSASDGTRTVVQPVRVRVTQPALESTSVSGRVVDEDGSPLSGVPVELAGLSAVSDEHGYFSIAGIPASPGPIRVGGDATQAEGRLALTAPVPDLLGHPIYDRADNVFPESLILPKIAWPAATTSDKAGDADVLSVVNPAMPGFELRIPSDAGGRAVQSVSLSVADLPASLAAQHLAPGMGGRMILMRTSGLAPDQPVQLTMPNVWGYAPGDVLQLQKFNPITGGRDPVAEVVVSKDGRTVATTDLVTFGAAQTSEVIVPAAASMGTMGITPPVTLEACLIVTPSQSDSNPNGPCDGCQPGGNDTLGSGVGPGDLGSPGVPPGSGSAGPLLASDIGLVTGEFFQDHQTPSYYSLGADRQVTLEYSSLQANPRPVIQYEFTTPPSGASASITSITATISLGGVVQGSPVTYNTPSGLVNGQSYHVPMQVNATALATGSYPYTMTITEHFGSSTSFDIVGEGIVDVVNNSSGALGAGWTVGGLQTIHQATAGDRVVITAGRQGTQRFNPVYDDGQTQLLDLAIASGPAASQLMVNDGNANFSSPGTLSFNAAIGAAAGDLDGDGEPDQVVATTSNVGVLLNDGAGGFTAGSTYPTPSGYATRGIALGNFTGRTDGVLDLAVVRAPHTFSSNTQYTVAVYPGVGDGTFSTPVVSNVGNGAKTLSQADAVVAGDFDGDGTSDLAFTTIDGLLDVMIATTGGSMTSAGSLPLASGHTAVDVTAVDYNGDGKLDLVVESATAVAGGTGTFACLNLFTGTGSSGAPFTAATSTPYLTVGHPVTGVLGLVAGNFRGPSAGLEVGMLIHGDTVAGQTEFINLVPLDSSGNFGESVLHPLNNTSSPTGYGNVIAADLTGVEGRLSIAVVDGTGYVRVLSPDPDSNQFLPAQNIRVSSSVTQFGLLLAAPFAGNAATSQYRGPSSAPSTLVQDVGGTWTRTYPDGTVLQFDASGRETSATDRNGNATTYAYVASGQPGAGSLKTITDPVGLKTTFTYNGSGKLSTIKDPANRTTTVTVDANGNLTKIVDPDSAAVQFGYATPSNHRITKEINPRSKTVTVTYNAFGQATGEVLGSGGKTTTVVPAYSRGLVAAGGTGTLSSSYEGSLTDPNNLTTTIGFTWMSHPNSRQDSTGASSTTSYNRQGFPVAVRDALDRITTYTYDMNGNVTSITRPDDPPSGGWGVPAPSVKMTITYDSQYGVPTSVTDFMGRTTTYTLDSHGNVLRRTDPDELYERWTYNSAGQVLTDTDRIGATTTYHYDSIGRLDQVFNPSGAASYLQDVSSGGAATAGSAPVGGQGPAQAFDQDMATKWLGVGATWLQYQFAAGAAYTVAQYSLVSGGDTGIYTGRAPKNWQLQGSNDGLGWTTVDTRTNQADTLSLHTTTYTVASPGSYKYYRLNITANNGDVYTQLAELILTATVPSSVVVPASSGSIGYNAAGDVTSTTDELGNVWSFTYDAMGRLKSAQDPAQAAAGASVKTAYVYDAAGNLVSVTDALGHVVSYAYDDRNRLISMTEPVHQGTTKRTTYTYDGVNLIAIKDPLGHATSFSYDGANRLTGVKDALNHVTTYVYDAAGQLTSVIDPLNHATTYAYDSFGRVTSVSQPSNTGGGSTVVASYQYDNNDNVTRVVDALNHATTYVYDVLNRQTQVVDALNHATTYVYDPAGHVLATIDPLNHTTTNTYDIRGRLVSQTDPAGGGTTTYAYDLASRLTSLTDPVSNTTTWTYDDAGRVKTEIDPLSKVTTYSYDVVGNLTQTTDRLGRIIQYGYDADDRIKTEKWLPIGGGTAVNTITYTYDDAGRTTQVQDVASKYAYTYDAADRLLTVNDQGTTGLPQVTLTYGHDNADNRTSVSDTKGGLTTYAYNGRDQLTRVSQSGTGVAAKRVDFAYDEAGRRTSLTRYSDLAGTTKVIVTSYAYDVADRLTSIDHRTSGGTTRASYGYTLDAAGRLTSEARAWNTGSSTDTVTYGYTDDDQLTSVAHTNGSFAGENFSYDANGNRDSSGYATGSGNRTSTDGTYNYAYDDEGNQVSRTEIATGDQTLYKWDHRNRLTEVDSKVGGTTTVLATYTYDALDRRIGEKAGSSVRWTLYDGYSPILDFNAAGTQTARYLQSGPDVHDEVFARETSSGVAWYLPDRLGTVRDLAGNSGTIIDHVDYNAYGGVEGETSPAVGDRMVGFAGLERDTATGLNLAIYRAQDPSTGWWTSVDPLRFAAGDANIYRYVGNGPLNKIDPRGLLGKDEKKLYNEYHRAVCDLATPGEIIVTIIFESLIITNGNNTEALALIMSIRQENKGALDNDLWASADHFFNAWNAQDVYKNQLGENIASRFLGAINGTLANSGYYFCKEYHIPVIPQDKPDIAPSPPTLQQWWWGQRGGDASLWYPTNMRPGGPNWMSFANWLDSLEDDF